jgi:predicted GIY-YIG superfamily endonuclease
MNKSGIYKIISPTGKIYIGQSINIEKRWEGHKRYNGIGPKLKKNFAFKMLFCILKYHIKNLIILIKF